MTEVRTVISLVLVDVIMKYLVWMMLVALTTMQVAGLKSKRRRVSLKHPLGGKFSDDSLGIFVATQMFTLCFVIDLMMIMWNNLVV